MQAKQIARWVSLGALFLIPFTPLIVVDSYFFPFITGKAFYFRIVVEVAVSAWAVLAFLDKEYRPRLSWIGAIFVGFVVWMFIADAFAFNATKAFWSNFERMEGWVLLAHLLGFFFAASSVLRVEKKFRAWFLTSLCVSVVVSVYALLQLSDVFAIHQSSTRVDATMGNSAYLAIYLLFNVFIALWLAFTEDRAWLKWSLIVLATLESILVFFTETRGAILGLIVAFTLAAFLIAMTSGQKVRRFAIAALAVILFLVGGFYMTRDSSFVQGNRVLQRMASISLSDGQTRFTIWGMAFQGILERPLTGYGQEGFNYIFNKYYDPSLYKQEPWFDRAHNVFMDWLTAGGIPAFVLYISLFVSAILLLWKNSQLSRTGKIFLTAALAGYAVHNIFVFDNLYSYVYFLAILALIDSRVSKPIKRFENAPVLNDEGGVAYALPIAAAAMIVLIWFVNVPGIKAATNLIVAMSPSSDGVSSNITMFENLAANPSFASQEIREQIISFAAGAVQSTSVTDAEKQRIVTLAITEMQKQTNAYPLDARGHLQLSYAYRIAGDSANALKEIKIASGLSPKKEGIWIEAGVMELSMGNIKAAQTDFNTAYALGPQFPEIAVYAAAGYMVAGDQKSADDILIKAYGTTNVDSDILAAAYYKMKDWARLKALCELRAEKENKNPDVCVSVIEQIQQGK